MMSLEDLTNIATIIGTCFTFLAVLAAVFFSVKEIGRWHEDRSLENALRLEERFHSTPMRHARAQVANALIQPHSHQDLQSDPQEAPKKRLEGVYDEVNMLFNFFELLGFLVKKKIIEQHLAYFMFSQWLIPYWNAAEAEILQTKPDAWESLRTLHRVFVTINPQGTSTEDAEQFFRAETLSLTPQFEYHIMWKDSEKATTQPFTIHNPFQGSQDQWIFRVQGPFYPPDQETGQRPEEPPVDVWKVLAEIGSSAQYNKLGEEGWELVAILPQGASEAWVFKRPKP